MIKSSIYQLRLSKLILFLPLLLNCSSNEKFKDKNDIMIKIEKKEMLDDNNLIVTLSFKNNSNKNYVIPNYLGYYIVHIMQENIQYDAPGKIGGKIIASEFSNNLDDKHLKLLNLYYVNTFYKDDKCNKLSDFISFNELTYTSSLLFLPYNTHRKIIIVFNANYYNKNTLNNKSSRISLGLDFPKNFKILDSLLKKEKINYSIYDKSSILKDTLFINK